MKKKILVIDDDPTGKTLMQNRLTSAGYEVICVGNGKLGLVAVNDHQPDLIILDIEMPEMNGYTFIIELKKAINIATLPIIVLTSHEENKVMFARHGITEYLVKPVDFPELFLKMNGLLSK